MNEETKRYWDIGIGIAAPIITVLGILVGVAQFNSGRITRLSFSKHW
jgi:hypothetical protein